MPSTVSSVVRTLCRMVPAAVLCLFVAAPAQAQTAPSLIPYTAKLLAGGATTQPSFPGTCPISGNATTDAYGDGCLSTEILLVSARFAIADSANNVFFSDYTNGLVRRVDAQTGIVTAVAGGASSSPGKNVACGAYTASDNLGDGCLATAVKLSHPTGLIFDASGNLYFSDFGYGNVRKIAATSGLVPSTGGVISLIDGNIPATVGGTPTLGYASGVTAATAGYLDGPMGLAFDNQGDLFIAEEFKEAIMVVNTNTTGTNTVNGIAIPAGQVVKIAGAATGNIATCPNYPTTGWGCNYGLWTNGNPANSSLMDAPYDVAVDNAGNAYFANEYNNSGAKITSGGLIYSWGGIQNTALKQPNTKRGVQGTFAVGSTFGIVADNSSNVYLTDASAGVIWRIDGGNGNTMYAIAGEAAAVCSAATDTYGDGCPGLQATFGRSGTGNFATTTAPGPGIYGITEDGYSNLYFGDTETALIRELASGTQFGTVGFSGATQNVDIHFGVGDGPIAGSPYVVTTTSGSSTNIFSVGTANCTYNSSDQTQDCVVPVTVVPTTLGPFTGTLKVYSNLITAGTTFPLAGVYVRTPLTRTALTVANTVGCSTSTINAPTTPMTLTATITASSNTLTGTVNFYANGLQIGSPVAVSNNQAVLTYTFSTVGSYALTATYSGDGVYYTASTTATATNISTATPGFTISQVTYQQGTVHAGQTGLFSFTISQNVYAGNIAFNCSGLPAGAACVFNPPSIAAVGCTTSNTVAVSVTTQQGAVSAGLLAGRGPWSLLAMMAGMFSVLLIALRRRKMPLLAARLGIALALLLTAAGVTSCGSGGTLSAGTPTGSYTVTVTALGSTGTTASTPYTFVVN